MHGPLYKTQRWCGSFTLIIASFSSCFLTKFIYQIFINYGLFSTIISNSEDARLRLRLRPRPRPWEFGVVFGQGRVGAVGWLWGGEALHRRHRRHNSLQRRGGTPEPFHQSAPRFR